MPGGHVTLLHALGLSLLVGRLAHAHGVSRAPEDYRFRVSGVAMTLAALVGAAASLLFLYARYLVA